MTRKTPPVNMAASVRDRLRKRSREAGVDFGFLLLRYANERFLYRMQHSPHAGNLILKGAQLFLLWEGTMYRPTRDVDFLGFGEASEQHIRNVIRDICMVSDVPNDGLIFDVETISIENTRLDDEYDGFRIKMYAYLGQARIPMQFDVGYGDAVTPEAEEAEYPTILDFPAPWIRTYPVETVIAEKLEAMVRFGIANGRMKDFGDLHRIARNHELRGEILIQAIRATFSRRGAELPDETPVALTSEFYENPAVQNRWSGYLQKQKLEDEPLEDVIWELRRFLLPPIEAIRADRRFRRSWRAGGPWE
ncbi:nucleotidyl transferase AbiEii/AbiGii toxin family protein [bacterium]|nr:nucleotidyl transferase AbiEii/AbiGii toxin family protein [bacterium]